MTSDERQMLVDVHLAVVGNKELHLKGLGQRVDSLERNQAKINKKLLTWGGIATGIATAASYLFHKS